MIEAGSQSYFVVTFVVYLLVLLSVYIAISCPFVDV